MFTNKSITLEPVTHTYADEEGNVYTPVSSLIAKYKQPFDREKISFYVAQKSGQSQKDVLDSWEATALYGTAVHKQIENYFQGVDDDTSLIEHHLPTFSKWKQQPVTFHSEVILSTDKVAGTADMLIDRDGKWTILDWKTNATIDRTGYKGKKMLKQLSHLDDCKFVHYSLQLSIYAVMLGKPVKRFSLVHLPRKETTMEVIPCLDLRKEAELVLTLN